MGNLVNDERYEERNYHHDEPAYTTEHVGLFVSQSARCFVDMWLEESHHRSHEVPCEVDDSEEASGHDDLLVSEQKLERVQKPCILALSLCSLFGGCPFLALFKLALHIPCYGCHNEEREEHYARTEHFERCSCKVLTANGMSDALNPSVKVTARSEEHAQKEDKHRSEAP